MRAEIPSPTSGVWWLGPLPVRAYALCILLGIVVALWVCGRRLASRGHDPDKALEVAYWAVPFGIIGGRIYHVITTPQPYFGEGGRPLDALKIWQGGLGIWGAVALGFVGAWIGCRRAGIPILAYADAAVPGVALAQALGRWGNYFNNELYGEPTTVPWGLQIHEWSNGQAVRGPDGQPVVLGVFHPTFLYESIWCVLVAVALIFVDRRRRLHRGQVFGLYVLLYPVGRLVWELMRSDPANHVLGLRVNVWVSILVFLLGLAIVRWAGRTQPAGDTDVPTFRREGDDADDDDADAGDEDAADETHRPGENESGDDRNLKS